MSQENHSTDSTSNGPQAPPMRNIARAQRKREKEEAIASGLSQRQDQYLTWTYLLLQLLVSLTQDSMSLRLLSTNPTSEYQMNLLKIMRSVGKRSLKSAKNLQRRFAPSQELKYLSVNQEGLQEAGKFLEQLMKVDNTKPYGWYVARGKALAEEGGD